MYRRIAKNILDYFHYEMSEFCVVADETYVEIAQAIKLLHGTAEVRICEGGGQEQMKKVFSFQTTATVLLLAEPKTYVAYRLFQYLDFGEGEPRIPGVASRVLIFPKESICRMFSGNMGENLVEKERLMATMKAGRTYRITSPRGTELTFTSRNWIPLDFEICTAPMEATVNGVIVVDGALFFRKVNDTLTFVIKDGKIRSITAGSAQGKVLVDEYKTMTEGVMKYPENLQLAEIGIGFCHGATISDCFMEAETALHTCHFCFGNNVCYGGESESEFHGASVLIKEPVFTLMEK